MKSFARLSFCLLSLCMAVPACAGPPDYGGAGSITSKQTAAGTVTAVVTSAMVPNPDYDFDARTLKAQLNAQHRVEQVDGAVQLQFRSVAAQDYLIVAEAPTTIADVQTLYAMGVMMGALQGISPQIAGSALLAAGIQVPTQRTVILRNLHPESRIASYQRLTVNFQLPR